MKNSKLFACRLLMRLLTGIPYESMESAKSIIGNIKAIPPALLLEIAESEKYKLWSRVGAVYALGFYNYKFVVPGIIRIVEDDRQPVQLRCHAAEALGNIGDQRAIRPLGEISKQKGKTSVKKWCIYALSQYNTRQSQLILENIKSENPTGVIAKEVNSALAKFL